ncbi:MAG: helix-turn-helix domain-containing protein [Gammaproteobacteria bacterium]|nr:helix-turn-helix domain-containing protein [Gammaproteobacteria bacterium]
MNESEDITALDRAIAIAGTQGELANRASTPQKPISQQKIWWWKHKRGGDVPPEHVRALSKAVDGEVAPHEFQPEIFLAEAVS